MLGCCAPNALAAQSDRQCHPTPLAQGDESPTFGNQLLFAIPGDCTRILRLVLHNLRTTAI